MSRVVINQDLLAGGLQRGIGHIEGWSGYLVVPLRYRLRVPVCALASLAVQEHLLTKGVKTSVLISRPELPFEDEDKVEHIVAVAETDEGEPTIIDASFSQLLGLVGMGWSYDVVAKTSTFPAERVVAFKLSETAQFVGWLTEQAVAFQQVNTHPINGYGIDAGKGPLADASAKEIRSAYEQIWNPNNFSDWPAPAGNLEAGKKVASYISANAIEIC